MLQESDTEHEAVIHSDNPSKPWEEEAMNDSTFRSLILELQKNPSQVQIKINTSTNFFNVYDANWLVKFAWQTFEKLNPNDFKPQMRNKT